MEHSLIHNPVHAHKHTHVRTRAVVEEGLFGLLIPATYGDTWKQLVTADMRIMWVLTG